MCILLSHNQYWYFYIKADIFLAITLGFILLATPLFIYIILPQTDLFVNAFFYINNKICQNSFAFLYSCCPLTFDWFFETLYIFHNSCGNILFFLRTNSTALFLFSFILISHVYLNILPTHTGIVLLPLNYHF